MNETFCWRQALIELIETCYILCAVLLISPRRRQPRRPEWREYTTITDDDDFCFRSARHVSSSVRWIGRKKEERVKISCQEDQKTERRKPDVWSLDLMIQTMLAKKKDAFSSKRPTIKIASRISQSQSVVKEKYFVEIGISSKLSIASYERGKFCYSFGSASLLPNGKFPKARKAVERKTYVLNVDREINWFTTSDISKLSTKSTHLVLR